MTPDSFTPEERKQAAEAVAERFVGMTVAVAMEPSTIMEVAVDMQCSLTRERARREQAEEALKIADDLLRLQGAQDAAMVAAQLQLRSQP
jgi:hypothetical protein